ncbi:MAG TPA: cell division ATP-binding protein FtsE [Candidatus Marinimicrobia bacterium]|jgi:cell division transport system ATP-binding protein|nr:cell division ATP-binding protein FtsE [Candidatus Neomarinimicrobiota bacterium]MDP6230345.1 ATP-binding cassette domain-containing protein [Candidatus Neomarinimicrobiota bacterium]MDP7512714.1 ATP-binding cassette domain-containing protein [Candidatus Neomarinimicrobiota bacterium]HBR86318.1 cell division ATP-binding protein FtsE [Candidatus Neomarinimicrobiota bacterium]HJM12528.1 ATP-binding cassette domain-containing protein [Candidatus Neomarinimicrobiota bacterium]|tara:strand:- start:1476 stop:2132 length:657 start_codon:yes stop_codon:yes gene_type:complete
MIQLKNVSYTYRKGFGLANIDLKINDGEFVFLIGPTGSGKTTLLSLMHMEIFPESGKVTIGDFDSDTIKKRKIPTLRRSIGLISQNYHLLDDRNLFENVALPLHVIGHNQNDISEAVEEALDEVGLSGFEDHFPQELSGGEQQRACLARALIKDPKIILADEPTGNLDPVTSFDLVKLLEEINSEEGTTVFMASHNYSLIKSRNHRIVEIHDGKLRSA